MIKGSACRSEQSYMACRNLGALLGALVTRPLWPTCLLADLQKQPFHGQIHSQRDAGCKMHLSAGAARRAHEFERRPRPLRA
eukprot:15479004-Alexandrium_andersonii.AAC.1